MALTKEGYAVKRLAELKKEYDRLLINRFGPINTQPDSVIGQLEGIWAEALANLYEQAQDTYHAMYPFSAEGVSGRRSVLRGYYALYRDSSLDDCGGVWQGVNAAEKRGAGV